MPGPPRRVYRAKSSLGVLVCRCAWLFLLLALAGLDAGVATKGRRFADIFDDALGKGFAGRSELKLDGITFVGAPSDLAGHGLAWGARAFACHGVLLRDCILDTEPLAHSCYQTG